VLDRHEPALYQRFIYATALVDRNLPNSFRIAALALLGDGDPARFYGRDSTAPVLDACGMKDPA
ncbi:MAG: hypothetical protein AAGF49_12325, partial [Pseudomonadota bacterium]